MRKRESGRERGIRVSEKGGEREGERVREMERVRKRE